MIHVRRGGSIPVNRWLVGGAALFVVASLVWVHSPLWGKEAWLGLPAVLTGFDKTFLSLPRLLHILSVSLSDHRHPRRLEARPQAGRPSAGHPRQTVAAGVHRRHHASPWWRK